MGLLIAAPMSAQTVYDAAKIANKDLNGTARFVGMGGAMGALGGDISTIGTNPAGIGIYRSNDAMMSFSCAMQVNAFRKFHGIPCATTMCIGNMRSATEMLCKYQVTGNQELKKKSMHYYFVILVFAVGAAMGALFIRQIGDRTIWIAAILLLAGFVLMFIKEDREYVRR